MRPLCVGLIGLVLVACSGLPPDAACADDDACGEGARCDLMTGVCVPAGATLDGQVSGTDGAPPDASLPAPIDHGTADAADAGRVVDRGMPDAHVDLDTAVVDAMPRRDAHAPADAAPADAAPADAARPDSAPVDAAPPPPDAGCPADAVEVCDGADNDCDDAVDEAPECCAPGDTRACGFQRGVCFLAAQGCADLQYAECPGFARQRAEQCDARDDDCDGEVDEDLVPPTCGVPFGVCATATKRCGGAEGWLRCTPAELAAADPRYAEDEAAAECDDVDNDCDGQADEGCPCADGETRPCGIDAGRCTVGVQTCEDGFWGGCDGTGPLLESCNDEDDDCDGAVDEDYGAGRSCTVGLGNCTRRGVLRCEAEGADSFCDAPPLDAATIETCDGTDDDCDGLIDEDLLNACGACGEVPVEACNGADDDCDGLTDEGLLNACGTCGDAPAEVCNALDDDCDGRTDEGLGLGNACSAGVGECTREGRRICGEADDVVCDAVPGEPAGDERCNTRDDDCDGMADEGLMVGQPCTNGTGACRTVGAFYCDEGELVQCDAVPGEPVPEVCDGVDQDCNGRVDDGLGLGLPCTVGVGACQREGVAVCGDDGETTCGATPGPRGDETCNGIDDDCDGLTDDEAPCPEGQLCQAGGCVEIPAPPPDVGEVVINEVMFDPTPTLGANAGQWLELESRAGERLDLIGCTLTAGARQVTLGALFLEPGARAVLGRDADPATNGGVTVHQLFNFDLDDGDVLVFRCADAEIDRFDPALPGLPRLPGWSTSAVPAVDAQQNDEVGAWCLVRARYAPGLRGTPGAPNPPCDVPVDACQLRPPLDVTTVETRPFTVTARVEVAGITDASPGLDADPLLRAEVGVGPVGTAPDHPAWQWADASGNPNKALDDEPATDEYVGESAVDTPDAYLFAARFSADGGRTWTACDGDRDEVWTAEAAGHVTVRPFCEPNPCTAPPAAECSGPTTRRVFDSPGVCAPVGGEETCTYPPREEPCGAAQDCIDGACVDRARPEQPGDVVIAELMAQPGGGLADAQAEWVELRNTTAEALDLDGCTLDVGGEMQALAGLLAPGVRWLLVAGLDPALNGALMRQGALTVPLPDAGSTAVLTCAAGEIDRLEWAAGDAGFAFGRDAVTGAVCGASSVYFVDGDGARRGTPGKPNDPCALPLDACTLIEADVAEAIPTQAITVIGRLTHAGLTDRSGDADTDPLLRAQVGHAPDGAAADDAGWIWVDAAPLAGSPEGDTWQGPMRAPTTGDYDLAARFSIDGGRSWTVCDTDGSANGYDPAASLPLAVGADPCEADGRVCGPKTPVCTGDGRARLVYGAPIRVCDGARIGCEYAPTRVDCDAGETCRAGVCEATQLPDPAATDQLMIVPYTAAKPHVPHPAHEGAPVTLKAALRNATCGTYEVRWDLDRDGLFDDEQPEMVARNGTTGSVWAIGRTYIVPTVDAPSRFDIGLQVQNSCDASTRHATYPLFVHDFELAPDPRQWTDAQLEVASAMAVDEALWWLYRHLTSFAERDTATMIAQTSFARTDPITLWAFSELGHLPAHAPTAADQFGDQTTQEWRIANRGRWSRDPYAEAALRLTNAFMTNAGLMAVDPTDEAATCGLAYDGTPTVCERLRGTSDGLGAVAGSVTLDNSYIRALATAGVASSLAALDGSPIPTGSEEVMGESWPWFLQQLVDGLGYAQLDGGCARGSWTYVAMDGDQECTRADATIAQWAYIGLEAAERHGRDVGVFVNNDHKYRIADHLVTNQQASGGAAYRSSYTKGSFFMSAGAVHASRWLGIHRFDTDDARVAFPGASEHQRRALRAVYNDYVQFLVDTWSGVRQTSTIAWRDGLWREGDPLCGNAGQVWNVPPCGYIYALFMVRTALLAGERPVDVIGNRNWRREFATYLTRVQRRDAGNYDLFGSLPEETYAHSVTTSYGSNPFRTSLAVLTLADRDLDPPPVAVIEAALVEARRARFTADLTHHPSPTAEIVRWQWDLDATDGLWWATGNAPDVDASTSAPVEHTYPRTGTFTATLRVVDTSGRTATHAVQLAVP